MSTLYRHENKTEVVRGEIQMTDSGGIAIDPATESTLGAIAASLGSQATDTLRVEQQTPVGIEDTGGSQVDPATETTLAAVAGALASNATDHIQIQEDSPLDVSGATVSVQEAAPLDVSGATVTMQEAAPLDVSGATVTTTESTATLGGTVNTGQAEVTSAGTAVQFNGGTSLSVPDGSAVRVSAPSSNAGMVYVGDASVSATTGYGLPAGAEETIPVNDVSALWVDADNANDVATWLVVTA